jgi:hypothetical protein
MKLRRKSATQCCNSISSAAQYVTLYKYFSNPSSVVYFFPTLLIKLTLQLQINGRLLIANHLDYKSEIGSGSEIIFLTLLSGRLLGFAVPITSSFFFGAKFALGSMKRTP